ncbi:MAG TPA: TIM-barrel domain-containing protein [Bacteroidales bacterium]|nr:TIM-barrel domain-containing protein [Bacteroidales bacterium]
MGGYIQSDNSGSHKFRTFSAGYLKLWIDGEKIVDNWRQAWNPWTNKFRLDMEPGKKYHIKLQWIPDGGESYVALNWLSPVDPVVQNRLSLYSEVASQIDYYFVNGNSQDELISGYRQLTGKSPIMPRWAMGFWQSRERYKTQEELLDVVREYRKRDIPLDNIVLDWQYWRPDTWGSHEFDPSRFPHPEQMIDSLHQNLNAHIMISVWPKFYVGTKNYEALNKKGWLYTKNVELGRKDWIGYVSTFYDAFNPDARKLYWEQINKSLNSKGIDAWWMDATEPDITSNVSIEGRKELMSPVALGPSAEYFNAFSLMNCSAIYNGSRQANPDKRVFMLTRSAFAGQQRYAAATWSGDIVSRWYDMQAQIPAGINFCMSGIPYWTMDIGGFAVERRYEHPDKENLVEWRELQTRWFQFGSFLPVFRSHGQFPYREIFNIAPKGHPAYQSMVHYDKLRYRLMPYIYSLAGATYLNNYTIMRGLVMDFPEDPQVRNIGDQYMFGPSLMVCPVYTYKARSRKVYLPEGTNWYDLNTGALITGGNPVEANAPYTRIPVYVKEGSIIPVGKAIQYTGQKVQDTLTLVVYTGSDGHFNLYEDEGVNYNYEKGKYSIIPLTYNNQEKKLSFGARKGEFTGMLNERIFRIQVVSPGHNVDLLQPGDGGKLIQYNGKKLSVAIE